jgi:hypothetical protein|tara:strand:+ start:899 stop:1102 length:204 start_codon:yes stop_codon:yes gene_type:complete
MVKRVIFGTKPPNPPKPVTVEYIKDQGEVFLPYEYEVKTPKVVKGKVYKGKARGRGAMLRGFDFSIR